MASLLKMWISKYMKGLFYVYLLIFFVAGSHLFVWASRWETNRELNPKDLHRLMRDIVLGISNQEKDLNKKPDIKLPHPPIKDDLKPVKNESGPFKKDLQSFMMTYKTAFLFAIGYFGVPYQWVITSTADGLDISNFIWKVVKEKIMVFPFSQKLQLSSIEF